MEDSLLAELLVARLCHDLAGAVGAVSAGAELLQDEGMATPLADEAVALMAASAASMTAKLRFFRLALGPVNDAATRQARDLADAFFSKAFPDGEWQLDWPLDQAAAASPSQAKLLLTLIWLAQECLPRGGMVAVRPQQPDLVTAIAVKLVAGEALRGLTAGATEPHSPRSALGVYAGQLARGMGLTIAWREEDGALSFSVQDAKVLPQNLDGRLSGR